MATAVPTWQVPPGALGLLNSVGALLSNVDRVPIKLKALVIENAFTPAGTLLSSIASSFKEQIVICHPHGAGRDPPPSWTRS